MSKKTDTQNISVEEFEINGRKYILTIVPADSVPADSVPAPKPNGNRAVVVVDRGWIFAGDVEERDNKIHLSRAVWVFGWKSVGFASALKNPRQEGVDIREIDDVVIPGASEIFRVPVADDWGL